MSAGSAFANPHGDQPKQAMFKTQQEAEAAVQREPEAQRARERDEMKMKVGEGLAISREGVIIANARCVDDGGDDARRRGARPTTA